MFYRKFGVTKSDKNLKEVAVATIQKDLLTLEEQEVAFPSSPFPPPHCHHPPPLTLYRDQSTSSSESCMLKLAREQTMKCSATVRQV